MNINPKSELTLGLINFTNCIPVNYSLSKWNLEKVSLLDGYPTLINRLIKDKKVVAAPISSIEYLENQDTCTLIESACISSIGDVGSVILFSGCEFNQLENKTIAVPFTSSTSIALLKVLLNEQGLDVNTIKFITHKYELPLEDALNTVYDAVLYIGDPALVANIKFSTLIKYDLGRMWKKLTGYPMTFGTWVALSDWKMSNEDDFKYLKFLLDKAVESGLSVYFNDIVNIASNNLNLDQKHIQDYLTNKINYNFTDEHKKGLELFQLMYNKLKMRTEEFIKC